MSNPFSGLVHRAALPEVLFVPDLASALQLTPVSTRRAVLRGDCGPYFRVGRRLAVLRESFLNSLARRQVHVLAGPSATPARHMPEGGR
jgi:hypothetical protein